MGAKYASPSCSDVMSVKHCWICSLVVVMRCMFCLPIYEPILLCVSVSACVLVCVFNIFIKPDHIIHLDIFSILRLILYTHSNEFTECQFGKKNITSA